MFLLVGVVVNVVVAWSCALRQHLHNLEGHSPTEDDTRWWDAHVPEGFSVSPFEVGENPAFGISESFMFAQLGSPTKFPPSMVNRRRAGLPVPAFEGSTWVDFRKGEHREIERHLMKMFDDRPPVPVRPIWPGFAINTIFYATILWLPFAPFQLQRYVRVKRGHCIKCGYDLRGGFSAGCPECGWQRASET